METKNKEISQEEELDFSSIGEREGKKEKKKSAVINNSALNTKTISPVSKLLCDVYEEVTKRDVKEGITGYLLTQISNKNEELGKFFKERRNLCKGFAKPAKIDDSDILWARKTARMLQKAREMIGKKYNLSLSDSELETQIRLKTSAEITAIQQAEISAKKAQEEKKK